MTLQMTYFSFLVKGCNRVPVVADVPAAAQVDIPELEMYGTGGIVAPTETPKDISIDFTRSKTWCLEVLRSQAVDSIPLLGRCLGLHFRGCIRCVGSPWLRWR